jgi:uncharacterized membrane protein YjfL (UPF0719 family)
MDDLVKFLSSLGLTILWSVVSILLATVVFEVLDRKYHLMKEIFDENSTAAAVLAASFVIGIFYVVATMAR